MVTLTCIGNFHFMPSESLPLSVNPDAGKPVTKRAFHFSGVYMENWKPVVGYEGSYLVSDYGRVESLLLRKKILAPAISHWGYRYVSLTKDSKQKNKKVARLVLEAFVGPCPNGWETCHGPNGKLDDSLKNLSWGSKRKNCVEDKKRDGVWHVGEKNGRSKLTESQVRELFASTECVARLARRFSISEGAIWAIKRGRNWRHLSLFPKDEQ